MTPSPRFHEGVQEGGSDFLITEDWGSAVRAQVGDGQAAHVGQYDTAVRRPAWHAHRDDLASYSASPTLSWDGRGPMVETTTTVLGTRSGSGRSGLTTGRWRRSGLRSLCRRCRPGAARRSAVCSYCMAARWRAGISSPKAPSYAGSPLMPRTRNRRTPPTSCSFRKCRGEPGVHAEHGVDRDFTGNRGRPGP